MRDKHFSEMSIIAIVAAGCAIIYIPAGFLALITGFAALDEIRKYSYRGKIATIAAMVIGMGSTAANIYLSSYHQSTLLDFLVKGLPGSGT